MSEDWASGEEWDDFVRHVRTDLIQKLDETALVISLIPRGEVDIKFAVELGLSIMMGKPIIAVALPGAFVPENLRRVVDSVVETDIDTEAGREELQRAISAQLEKSYRKENE